MREGFRDFAGGGAAVASSHETKLMRSAAVAALTGGYRLRVVPTDLAGNVGRARTAPIRIGR